MVAALLGLLGLVAGAALSPLATRLAAWPEADDGGGHSAPPRSALAGGSRNLLLALLLERPGQMIVLGLATGAVFAAAGLRYDGPGEVSLVMAYATVLLICAATDILSYRVPNAVTYPALAGALIVAAFVPQIELKTALAGAGVAGGILLALGIVSRGGIGLGDVKLAAFAGLALGWPLAFSALFVTALAGGLASALVLLLRLRHRQDPLPYAPFIAAAALAVMLWQGAAFREL